MMRFLWLRRHRWKLGLDCPPVNSRCKADDIDLVIRLWVTGITGYTLAVDVNTRGCDSGTTGVL